METSFNVGDLIIREGYNGMLIREIVTVFDYSYVLLVKFTAVGVCIESPKRYSMEKRFVDTRYRVLERDSLEYAIFYP